MVKKRRIAKKPDSTAASSWVQAGGSDPEIKHPDIQTSENLNIQTLKHSDTQTSKPLAKSKDPEFTRCTLYLSKALHKRLKIHAVANETEHSDIAEQAIAQWLNKHSDV